MSFFKNLKKNVECLKDVKVSDKDQIGKTYYKVVKGEGSIFTKRFSLSQDRGAQVYVNGIHKVDIIDCVEYHETETIKSAGKKVAGGAAGGLVAGPAGAIVGALAFGNNKKKVSKYSKLIAVDENGHRHEVIIDAGKLQRGLIISAYKKIS